MFTQLGFSALLAALAAANASQYTNSDWTTLVATGTVDGAITDYLSSFAIAVVPVTTGTFTNKVVSTGAAQLEAALIAGSGNESVVDKHVASATDKDLDLVASSAIDLPQATDDLGSVDDLFGKRDDDSDDDEDADDDDDDDDDESTDLGLALEVATDSSTSTDSEESLQTSSAYSNSTTGAGSSDVQNKAVVKDSGSDPITTVSCSVNATLSMTLKDGILVDSEGRIGSIVANRQFQFDGPPPQAGAIYAKGWSITKDGYLAIGSTEIFYRCLSGEFYNLYDQNVAYQCSPIKFLATGFGDC